MSDPKPNRVPNFRALFENEAEFEYQRHAVPATGARALTRPGLEEFRSMQRLPPGVSLRELGLEIARAVGATIVSEHEGLIDTLLITVPRDANAINPLDARHYAALFRGLGEWVKYVVVCDPRQQAAIASLAAEAGLPSTSLTFVLSPRFAYSIWAQDAYVALNDASKTMILCEGVSFPRYEDMTIADDVAAQSEVSVLQAYLYFQGGNVLNSGKVTLIGRDYIERNTRRFNLPDAAAVEEAFARLFGTDIIPLGGERSGEYAWYADGRLSGYGFQPIFHIDMYVTPTGVQGPGGKEIVLLGRPAAARKVVGRYSDVRSLDNPKYDSFFDETEAALAKTFEVKHLPLWITQGRLGTTQTRYYNLTFNNCIVQNAPGRRRVLLPSYSQDASTYGVDGSLRMQLERAAETTWRDLGFEVSWMDGVEDLAFNAGAVHCITKTLRRS